MDNQAEVKADVPQGTAKMIGRVVGIALILMATVVGFAMYTSHSGGSTSSDSATTQPLQPTAPAVEPQKPFSAPQQ